MLTFIYLFYVLCLLKLIDGAECRSFHVQINSLFWLQFSLSSSLFLFFVKKFANKEKANTIAK